MDLPILILEKRHVQNGLKMKAMHSAFLFHKHHLLLVYLYFPEYQVHLIYAEAPGFVFHYPQQTTKDCQPFFPNYNMKSYTIPDFWYILLLLIYAGDTYKNLQDYNHAKYCWIRAYQLDKEAIDSQYSLACYYIENNLFKQAEQVLNEIISWNNERGYEIENKWPENELRKLKQNNNF